MKYSVQYATFMQLHSSIFYTALIEETGLKPILNLLKSLGGWPVLEKNKWEDRFFEWKHSTYELRRLGYSTDYFFTFITDIDLKNSSKRVIHVGFYYQIHYNNKII